MHLNASPSASPKSPTLSIGFASSMDSVRSASSQRAASSSQGSACAYPSWPTADSLRPHGSFAVSSSYISDAELFGLDDVEDDLVAASMPYLSQAPSPPRQYALPSQAPLAPLYAPAKPEKKQRRKSSRKQSHRAQPMTPISESPETPE